MSKIFLQKKKIINRMTFCMTIIIIFRLCSSMNACLRTYTLYIIRCILYTKRIKHSAMLKQNNVSQKSKLKQIIIFIRIGTNLILTGIYTWIHNVYYTQMSSMQYKLHYAIGFGKSFLLKKNYEYYRMKNSYLKY